MKLPDRLRSAELQRGSEEPCVRDSRLASGHEKLRQQFDRTCYVTCPEKKT